MAVVATAAAAAAAVFVWSVYEYLRMYVCVCVWVCVCLWVSMTIIVCIALWSCVFVTILFIVHSKIFCYTFISMLVNIYILHVRLLGDRGGNEHKRTNEKYVFCGNVRNILGCCHLCLPIKRRNKISINTITSIIINNSNSWNIGLTFIVQGRRDRDKMIEGYYNRAFIRIGSQRTHERDRMRVKTQHSLCNSLQIVSARKTHKYSLATILFVCVKCNPHARVLNNNFAVNFSTFFAHFVLCSFPRFLSILLSFSLSPFSEFSLCIWFDFSIHFLCHLC